MGVGELHLQAECEGLGAEIVLLLVPPGDFKPVVGGLHELDGRRWGGQRPGVDLVRGGETTHSH